MPDKLQEWLELLGSQLQWKPGRELAVRELKAHILDQQEDFQARGMNEEEALTASLKEMGDPVEIGAELDKLHRPQSCLLPLLVIVALTILGIFIQSALPATNGATPERYILYTLFGAVLMLALWRVNYTLLFRLSKPALIAVIAVIAFYLFNAPIVCGINSRAGQILLLLPLLLVYALVKLRNRGGWKLALGCFVAAGLVALCIWRIPSHGTEVFLFVAISFVLMLMASAAGWFGSPKKAIVAILGACAAIMAVFFGFILSAGYYIERLIAFFTVQGDIGFQFRLLRGIGGFQSRTWFLQRHRSYLDLAYLSDLIGTSVFVVSFAAIVILAVLLWRRISRLHSVTGRLTATACALTLISESLIYWLYNLGWFPVSPPPFPFLSWALMLQVVNYILAGVLLSTFRHDSVVRDRSYPANLFGWQVKVTLKRKA